MEEGFATHVSARAVAGTPPVGGSPGAALRTELAVGRAGEGFSHVDGDFVCLDGTNFFATAGHGGRF